MKKRKWPGGDLSSFRSRSTFDALDAIARLLPTHPDLAVLERFPGRVETLQTRVAF